MASMVSRPCICQGLLTCDMVAKKFAQSTLITTASELNSCGFLRPIVEDSRPRGLCFRRSFKHFKPFLAFLSRFKPFLFNF